MSSSEDKLNVTTESFDPLASIYSESGIDIPDPSAPIFDNVESFVSKVVKPAETKKSNEAKPSTSGPVPSRRFTEDQMPVPGRKKIVRNIFTFMQKQSEGGPMSVLSRCVEKRVRVKVVTRKLNGARGFCTGIIVAFDKHWNLALIDVDETYSRLRHRKPEADALSDEMESKLNVAPATKNAMKRETVGESTVQIVKTRRSTELCQRHVPQVVLRGEHVVLVQPLDT